MNKKISLLAGTLLTILSLSYSAQTNDSVVVSESVSSSEGLLMYGNFKFGIGQEGRGNRILDANFGINAILQNDIYIGLGFDLGIGAGGVGTTEPFVTKGYSLFSLKIGYVDNVSNKFRVIPYAGIGYQALLRTSDKPDVEYNKKQEAANELSAALSEVTETEVGSKSFKKSYLVESLTAFSIPVGVDFHLHGKHVGFVIGAYANISKYADLGVRMGITFGKLRN